MSKTLSLIPKISEKTYAQSQNSSVYVFVVPKNSNRITIKQAVTSQFNVTVENVNIAYLPTKPKRTVRGGGRNIEKGSRSAIKKAYVTLKQGDSIPIYASEEDKKKEADKSKQARSKK